MISSSFLHEANVTVFEDRRASVAFTQRAQRSFSRKKVGGKAFAELNDDLESLSLNRKEEKLGSNRRKVVQGVLSGLFAASIFQECKAGAEQESLFLKAESRASVDTTITAKAFFDFSLCPTIYRQDRTLGDTTLICNDGEPLGRVVIGLYGNQVPLTVEIFKAMVTGSAGSSYKGSVIHKILPGQYIQAGRQGSVEKGEVNTPKNLPRNTDSVNSRAFLLGHSRPGTVSLSLGTNDDDIDRKLEEDYRNVEFLITTGPGPAIQLDSGNIVFGTVIEGMDVISKVASVPTFKPSERIVQFNEFAQLLGDDRAEKGRAIWNRPLKSIVIQDCGLL